MYLIYVYNRTTTLDTLRCVMHVAILFSINLLNYMDRYTIAGMQRKQCFTKTLYLLGVLTDLQTHFSMNDAQAGLLQTVFIIFFMVFAPICGFLGDRYNRKMIMVIGLLIWVSAVLASSFIPRNVSFLQQQLNKISIKAAPGFCTFKKNLKNSYFLYKFLV